MSTILPYCKCLVFRRLTKRKYKKQEPLIKQFNAANNLSLIDIIKTTNFLIKSMFFFINGN